MRCPKSRFPIQIIVFDELELIIFVSQGLTLSTASLDLFIFEWKHNFVSFLGLDTKLVIVRQEKKIRFKADTMAQFTEKD